jgi:CheY-like chemotaxis protein
MVERATVTHAPSSTERPASDARGPIAKVLIIDDEIRVAHALRVVLSDEFDTAAMTRPEEALSRLTSGDSFDVILCDVMMPSMSGIELRDRVRAVRPELADRFVFLTGGVVRANVREQLGASSNEVVEKPIDLAALRELIRQRVRR